VGEELHQKLFMERITTVNYKAAMRREQPTRKSGSFSSILSREKLDMPSSCPRSTFAFWHSVAGRR
jgi:hypothetical protein